MILDFREPQTEIQVLGCVPQRIKNGRSDNIADKKNGRK